ncbi:MAG: hypothetical protein HOB12_00625 [Gemmatimonadales bacterium]|nr:hypothetical protein [Gemmatimonadales bacterium]
MGGNGSRRFCLDYMYGDVLGMFIGGLAAENPGGRPAISENTRYYFYNVYAANESLSYVRFLEDTVCEAN